MSIKVVRSQGEEELSSEDIFSNKGEDRSSDAPFFTLFKAKTSDFSKFILCPYEKESVRTFCGRGGGGQIFNFLCGRLLWMASYPDDCFSLIIHFINSAVLARIILPSGARYPGYCTPLRAVTNKRSK